VITALLTGLGIALIAFAVTWAICLRIRNYSFLDVAWSYGVMVLAPIYAAMGPGDAKRKWIFAAVGMAWSFRLGTYIFLRVLRHHPQEDVRYEGLRKRWPGAGMFLVFFELQALIVVIFSVPFLLAAWNQTPPGLLEYAGLGISLLALAGESLADRQMKHGVPRWFQWQIIGYSWASRGRWDSALVAMERAARDNSTSQSGLAAYRLAAIGRWLGAVEPSVVAERRLRAGGATDVMRPDHRAELAWLDGLVAVTERDTTALAVARVALRQTGAPEVALLDSSLAAFALDLRGDRPRALALLLALEQDRYRIDNVHPYLAGVHRMTASRWLAVSGDTLGAARLLTWHESMGYRSPQELHANALLAPFANLERAPLLQALGQRQAARDLYERFLAMYDSPIGAHQGLVAEARADLARTTRP